MRGIILMSSRIYKQFKFYYLIGLILHLILPQRGKKSERLCRLEDTEELVLD